MSRTVDYLRVLVEQDKRRGPSMGSDTNLFPDLGSFTSSPDIEFEDVGGEYKIVRLDVEELPEFLMLKSGLGPDKANHSLIIYGRPGIGKSAIVKQTAKDIAAQLGKQFVDFNQVFAESRDQMVEIFDNADKYYCFIDIRAGSYESFEFKGIPESSKDIKGTVDSLDMLWIRILTMPNSSGMLFLDEINQAKPDTQNALFGLLHYDERIIAEKGIRNAAYWSVHGAGNLGSQFQGTNELNKALVNRVSTVYFTITFDGWMKFAKSYVKKQSNGQERPVYHDTILKFLQFISDTYPDKINKYFADEDETNVHTGDPNPRNFEKLSSSIYTLEDWYRKNQAAKNLTPNDFLKKLAKLAASDLNSVWADEFINYLIRYRKSSIEEMLRQPERHLVLNRGGKGMGVEKDQFFVNLSILQDRINGFIGEYIEAFNYGQYLQRGSSWLADKDEGKLPTPDPDVDIQAYNDYAMTFFEVINSMVRQKQPQNAAIVYSYMRDSVYKGRPAWDIFRSALAKNLSKEQRVKFNEFISSMAKDLNSLISNAKQELENVKAGTSNTGSEQGGDEEEEEAPGIDIDSANIMLKQLFNKQDQIAKRAPELSNL